VPAERRVVVTRGRLVVPVRDGEDVQPGQVFVDPDGTRWRCWREGDPLEEGRVRLEVVKAEYRRLQVGDRVKAGQTVAVMDPAWAIARTSLMLATLETAWKDASIAAWKKGQAEERVTAMEEAVRRAFSVSKDDYEGAKLIAKRYAEELAARKAAADRQLRDLLKVQGQLSRNEVRAPAAGVIQSIGREAGDVVREGETLLTVGADPRRPAAPAASEWLRDICGVWYGVHVVYATEILDHKAVAPDRTVTIGSGAAAKLYRRLQVGDRVEAGQLVALSDDPTAGRDVPIREANLRACEAELRAAGKGRELAELQLQVEEKKSWREGGGNGTVEGARRQLSGCQVEEAACRAHVTLAQAELDLARMFRTTHEIRSPVGGVIRALLKHPGEAVGPGEPVLWIAVSPRR
jgi:biotin carboxyl carrier protein